MGWRHSTGRGSNVPYVCNPVEVEYDDFLSQYPSINALMDLQALLLSKEIQVRSGSEVTEAVRAGFLVVSPWTIYVTPIPGNDSASCAWCA